MRIYFILLFVFTISSSYGQSVEILLKCKEYPKGTNIITINTANTISVAFKKIASIILDYGFTISNSDKELYYINTDFVTFNNYSFKTKIGIRLKSNSTGGTSIIIKGETTNSGYSFPAYNFHRKDVPNRGFTHMLAISLKYEGGKVLVSEEK